MSQPNVVANAPAASLWEDFIDIFASPASVFRRREHGNWLIPLLIVTAAIFLITFASRGTLQPAIDAEVDRALELARKNPQVTEEVIDRIRGYTAWAFTYGTAIFIPIVIVFIGFMTWLVSRLVDSRQTLRAAMVVAAYSYVPRVVAAVVAAVQGLVLKPDQLDGLMRLSVGPARFLDPATTNPIVMAIAFRFDLFTIWVTILLAIGAYVTGRISKQSAVVAGVLFWVVGSLYPVFQAWRATVLS
ncbi:MAG TPA: YIP1 family protein [Gemmatimonadaceae bacterium]|nr:YIP1 family protein [Gemmatimonadaceae bacterium]